MKRFSPLDRSEILHDLSTEVFDLLVIGGGITGAGVARDAALRGMKVALVEAEDFASGTSSRSSKLVHGGIRYLENFEFKLVFEALSERQTLFEIAPNLVHPLRFMIPLYRQGRVGMFKMGLGMWAYDALSLFQAPQLHERLNHAESMEKISSLQEKDLLGSYIYSDAYMDDDRLVHETLRSAVDAGAKAISYVRAQSPLRDDKKKIIGVKCYDAVENKNFNIKAKHLVSSVGVWTDELGAHLVDQWKKILRPTKGVHLTFNSSRLQLPCAVVMAAEERIVFAIPRHEMVIVGTTDTDFHGDPAKVKVESEDVAYLLGVLTKYFPGANISAGDIVGSYAGVRPLVQDDSASAGKTSREHTIFSVDDGVTFVAGGKYTTYRLMAEQIVEESLKFFSLDDQVKWNRCQTELPLNPKATLEAQGQKAQVVEEICRFTTWSKRDAEVFFDRHGGEAMEIIQNYGPDKLPIETEAIHAIHNTMCFHLIDFYTRRVPLALALEDQGRSVLERIAITFAAELGWTEANRQREMTELLEYLRDTRAWSDASF